MSLRELSVFLLSGFLHLGLLFGGFLLLVRASASVFLIPAVVLALLVGLSLGRTYLFGKRLFQEYAGGACVGSFGFLLVFLYVGWVASTNPETHSHSSPIKFFEFITSLSYREGLPVLIPLIGVVAAVLFGHYLGLLAHVRVSREQA